MLGSAAYIGGGIETTSIGHCVVEAEAERLRYMHAVGWVVGPRRLPLTVVPYLGDVIQVHHLVHVLPIGGVQAIKHPVISYHLPNEARYILAQVAGVIYLNPVAGRWGVT